jgi:hypothetical protein
MAFSLHSTHQTTIINGLVERCPGDPDAQGIAFSILMAGAKPGHDNRVNQILRRISGSR